MMAGFWKAIMIGALLQLQVRAMEEFNFEKDKVKTDNLETRGIKVKDVTSLGVSTMLQCAIECTNLVTCRSISYNNNRCWMIGDVTLPGEEINMASLGPLIEGLRKKKID